jgi:hypothetical protein
MTLEDSCQNRNWDVGREVARYTGMLVMIYIWMFVNHQLNLIAKANIMKLLAGQKIQKVQYQTIIENLDQAVLSISDAGLEYFNIQGDQVL